MAPLPRLFVAAERLRDDAPPELRGAEHHYLVHVLRMQKGDCVLLLDGGRRVATARIAEVSAETLVLEYLSIETAPVHAGPRVTLYMGLLKGERHDFVIQKATELGACRIVTVVCKRTVPDLSKEREKRRQERWLRIAQAAAQQCRRPDLPEVTPPLSLQEAVQAVPKDFTSRLMLYEGLAPPLRSVLASTLDLAARPSGELALLIGPEGGFDETEVAYATAAGFIPCSLGSRVLRAETAALAALAVVVTA